MFWSHRNELTEHDADGTPLCQLLNRVRRNTGNLIFSTSPLLLLYNMVPLRLQLLNLLGTKLKSITRLLLYGGKAPAGKNQPRRTQKNQQSCPLTELRARAREQHNTRTRPVKD